MSVGRPGGRLAPSAIDRAVDRDGLCMLVHIGRPPGRPVSAAAVPLPWLPRLFLQLELANSGLINTASIVTAFNKNSKVIYEHVI